MNGYFLFSRFTDPKNGGPSKCLSERTLIMKREKEYLLECNKEKEKRYGCYI